MRIVHFPLPSPKGTNKERLFYPIAVNKIKQPVSMAMDSAFEENPGATDSWEQLCALLQEFVPPDRLEEAYGHLEHLLNTTKDDDNVAQDEPPPFPGRPRPGGTMAQDHRQRVVQSQIKRAADATASITKRYPNFARVRVVG